MAAEQDVEASVIASSIQLSKITDLWSHIDICAGPMQRHQAKAALAQPGGASSYRPVPCSWVAEWEQSVRGPLARLARARATPIIAL